jgi:hypothetical protein
MPKNSPDNSIKTCGTCTYRKSSVCLSRRLLQACVRISQNPEKVNANTLITLIREAEVLQRRKYKCAKEPNAWAHLMDRACAFWQPAEEQIVLSC